MPKGPRKVKVKTRFRKTWGYYYHYYDENLRRRTAQRDGFATEAEALAAGQAALKLHRRTLDVDTAKITFADFVEEVWKPYMSNRLAESTKKAYDKLLTPVLAVFGKIKMTSLSESYEKRLADYLDNRYLNTPDAFSSVDNTAGLFYQSAKKYFANADTKCHHKQIVQGTCNRIFYRKLIYQKTRMCRRAKEQEKCCYGKTVSQKKRKIHISVIHKAFCYGNPDILRDKTK